MISQVKSNKECINKFSKRLDKSGLEKKKTKWIILGLGAGAGFGGAKIGVIAAKVIALFTNLF